MPQVAASPGVAANPVTALGPAMGIAQAQEDILWSADHEAGDLSQWYYPSTGPFGDYGGGEFNSGDADSVASQDYAHSGSWSVKMTITTPSVPESGTRLFRWDEPRANSQLYYSVWYYFPQTYSVSNWWNVFQWKSRTATDDNQPFFVLNVGNQPDGTMYFYLYDWQQRVAYQQSIKDIPVGQWIHVEAFYRCAGDTTGQVTFWQDGIQLFDLQTVQTRFEDGDCQWSVDNYSDSLTPNPVTIYVDDAVISTTRIRGKFTVYLPVLFKN